METSGTQEGIDVAAQVGPPETDTISQRRRALELDTQLPRLVEGDFRDDCFQVDLAAAEALALLGREAVARYGGMYGLTCVVDFAFSVGSVPNFVNRILRKLDIPKDHARTILASKSWGMNTSAGPVPVPQPGKFDGPRAVNLLTK